MLLALALQIVRLVNPEVGVVAEVFAQQTPALEFMQLENQKAEFTGKLHRISDLEVVNEIIRRSESVILDNTKHSEELLMQVEQKLQQASEKQLSFKKREGRLFLNTSVSSKKLKRLQQIYPRLRMIQGRASRSPKGFSLYLELSFVELRKEALRSLGLRFGQGIGFDTVIQPSEVSIENYNPIGSFLDAAINDGQAKIHFKQALVARSNRRAFFRSGGEYSVRVQSQYSAGIEKISYGIDLSFLAHALTKDRLGLELEASVREPTAFGSLDELPNISEKILKTFVHLRFEETFAIANLFRSTKSRASQRLPGLGELPFLGRLFESKSFLQNESEAYLFITPKKVSQKWRPQFDKF